LIALLNIFYYIIYPKKKKYGSGGRGRDEGSGGEKRMPLTTHFKISKFFSAKKERM